MGEQAAEKTHSCTHSLRCTTSFVCRPHRAQPIAAMCKQEERAGPKRPPATFFLSKNACAILAASSLRWPLRRRYRLVGKLRQWATQAHPVVRSVNTCCPEKASAFRLPCFQAPRKTRQVQISIPFKSLGLPCWPCTWTNKEHLLLSPS